MTWFQAGNNLTDQTKVQTYTEHEQAYAGKLPASFVASLQNKGIEFYIYEADPVYSVIASSFRDNICRIHIAVPKGTSSGSESASLIWPKVWQIAASYGTSTVQAIIFTQQVYSSAEMKDWIGTLNPTDCPYLTDSVGLANSRKKLTFSNV